MWIWLFFEKLSHTHTHILYVVSEKHMPQPKRKYCHVSFCSQDITTWPKKKYLPAHLVENHIFGKPISSHVNTWEKSCYDTITFDISLGPPLDPADAMSTIVPPAEDMSITVAPAGVVLVYKPRSMRKLFMESAPQLAGERSSQTWWCTHVYHSDACERSRCLCDWARQIERFLQDENKMKPV